MSRRQVDRLLCSLLTSGTSTGLDDGQLVERVAHQSGHLADQAFATLLERHGPMVLRVCRRSLRDPHDANDAFQATFLVLLRHARSIRRPGAVASWLHGVALRAAGYLRRQATRRRAHEAEAVRSSLALHPASRHEADELGEVIQQEIGRLPVSERSVVVLCELEGRSYDEAAQTLGCPVGTIKSRLFGARRRLRSRLSRRGFAPATVVLTAALAAESQAAPVPLVLLESTREAAHASAAGSAGKAAGLVPAGVSAIMRGVQGSMIFSKVKILSLLAATLVVTSAVALAQFGGSGFGQQPPAQESDRLQSLERKLDRLIRVLERSTGSADASPRASGAAGGYSVSLPERAPFDVAPAKVATASDPFSGRGQDLERRLRVIEERLDRLEAAVLRPQGQQNARSADLFEKVDAPASSASNDTPKR